MENEVSKRTLIVISIVTGITIILVAVISVTTVSNEECIIDIQEDLNDFHPLLLQQNSTLFLLPNNGSKIILSGGDVLLLACPGENNYLSVTSTALVEITCAFNKTFYVNDTLHSFEELKCLNYTEPSVRISEKKCAEKYTETEIGFNTSIGFIHVITTCFNDDTKDSLYSVHNLSSKTNYAQKTTNKKFIQGNFYPNLKLDNLYGQTSEKKIFQQIINASVDKYISKDKYFNRGHLAPNGDFIYRYQKRATYFYINVAPQWSKFNAGNWEKLESSCRNYTAESNLDLKIYTGIYGTVVWPDNNNKQSLSLYYVNKKKLLTVPNIYWKILYDPASKNGIVFISHNNQYENNGKPKPLCTNVCDQIKWISWKPEDLTLGYSYCCEYAEAKKIIKYFPELQIANLLI